MNMWSLVFSILFVVVSVFFGLKLAFVGILRAMNKGYRHMLGLGQCVYLFLCFTFGWNFFLLLQSRRWLTFFQAMVVSGVLVGPVSGIAVTLLTALLPARLSRHSPVSKARIPFTLAGNLLLFLGPVLAVVLYVKKVLPVSPSLRIVILSITIGVALVGLGRRAHLPSAAELLKLDPRAPVLYLRAFAREKDVFAKVSDDGQDFADRPRGERSYRTVEEFLGREINRDIGPFVALGSPLDFVPQDGAARLYSEDDTWTRDFADIGERAQRILLLPNYSNNLEFELHFARDAGWIHKLRVITRPELRLTKWEVTTWRIATWFAGVYASQRVAAHDWGRFTDALVSMGFGVGEDMLKSPLPGSVFALGPDHRMFLLRSGLTAPDEFVSVVLEGPSSEETSQSRPFPPFVPKPSTAVQIPRSRLVVPVMVAMSVVCLVAISLFANVRTVVNYLRERQSSIQAERAFAASPGLHKPLLLINGGQPLYAGARIRTKNGAGVFKGEDTHSVAVIIGEGQTGFVIGPAHGMPGVVSVLWLPQEWQEDIWANTWGIPGLYRKRYTQLPAFIATINADWLEIVP